MKQSELTIEVRGKAKRILQSLLRRRRKIGRRQYFFDREGSLTFPRKLWARQDSLVSPAFVRHSVIS